MARAARTSRRPGGDDAGHIQAGLGPPLDRRAVLAGRRLEAPEIEIEVRLGAGRGRATVYTCDLGYEYVRINAEYTT